MTIRLAAMEDLPAVYALLCDLEHCQLPGEVFREVYAQNLSQPSVRYLVAEEEGRVQGFISLRMDRPLHHAQLVGEIQELIVDEAARGRGVGALLLKKAQSLAAEAGCVQLELSSNFARTRAHAFYERHGWVKDHYSFTYKRLMEDLP